MSACVPSTDLGLMRDVLTAVNCNTSGFARLGYDALTVAGSPFQTALTIALTIYVAITGYRLFFARGVHLSDGPAIILKIGVLLALLTSWSVFQTLVFDMAARVPVEIARAVTLKLHGGDAIAGLQAAYDQLSSAAAMFAKETKASPANATAAETLQLASSILFAASAGLVAVLTVAIGVLTAIGPFFVALFLFAETRGFFAGWVRALAAVAFGLLSAWTVSVLALHVLDPWLSALSGMGLSALPDAETGITAAVIVFIFAASQAGLLLAGVMMARGFHLHLAKTSATGTRQIKEESAAPAPLHQMSRALLLAEQLRARAEIHPAAYARLAAAPATGGTRRTDAPTSAAPHLGDLYRRPAVARTNHSWRG